MNKSIHNADTPLSYMGRPMKRAKGKARRNRGTHSFVARYFVRRAGAFLNLRTWILRLREKILWTTCVVLRTTHQDRRIGVDLRGFGCGGAEVFSGEGEGKGVVLQSTKKVRSTHKMRLSARFHEGRVWTAFIGSRCELRGGSSAEGH